MMNCMMRRKDLHVNQSYPCECHRVCGVEEDGLLGKKFLKKGFRGTYTEDGKEIQLFLSILKDSREAAHFLKLFQEDLSKSGKVSAEQVPPFETRTFKGEDPYQGKLIVLQKGLYLPGAAGFEKEERVIHRLKELMGNIP